MKSIGIFTPLYLDKQSGGLVFPIGFGQGAAPQAQIRRLFRAPPFVDRDIYRNSHLNVGVFSAMLHYLREYLTVDICTRAILYTTLRLPPHWVRMCVPVPSRRVDALSRTRAQQGRSRSAPRYV